MTRAFLLIADIGGYTRFMKVHRVNLSHAQYVVAQLLEAVIDGASPTLELSKLEGDAAFFYAEATREGDVAKYARRIAEIRRAFVRRRAELTIDRMCTCDGCVQAGELKLKFVAHEGEVAFQKIKGHTELAGVGVILVHRLLKNSVPVPEYVLVSEQVHERLDEALRKASREIQHELEGFGQTRGFYIDLQEVESDPPPALEPSGVRKFFAWLKMTWKSLPYFFGLRTPCDGFRNMERVGPSPLLRRASEAPPSTGTHSLAQASLPPPPEVPAEARDDGERRV
jgi:class 3 adenylate cyclase